LSVSIRKTNEEKRREEEEAGKHLHRPHVGQSENRKKIPPLLLRHDTTAMAQNPGSTKGHLPF
jgi:hypothetical protein